MILQLFPPVVYCCDLFYTFPVYVVFTYLYLPPPFSRLFAFAPPTLCFLLVPLVRVARSDMVVVCRSRCLPRCCCCCPPVRVGYMRGLFHARSRSLLFMLYPPHAPPHTPFLSTHLPPFSFCVYLRALLCHTLRSTFYVTLRCITHCCYPGLIVVVTFASYRSFYFIPLRCCVITALPLLPAIRVHFIQFYHPYILYTRWLFCTCMHARCCCSYCCSAITFCYRAPLPLPFIVITHGVRLGVDARFAFLVSLPTLLRLRSLCAFAPAWYTHAPRTLLPFTDVHALDVPVEFVPQPQLPQFPRFAPRLRTLCRYACVAAFFPHPRTLLTRAFALLPARLPSIIIAVQFYVWLCYLPVVGSVEFTFTVPLLHTS